MLWRIQGRGPAAPPPYFLGQTEVERAAKSFFGYRQIGNPDSKIQVVFAWQWNPECGNQGFRILNYRKPAIKND